MCHQIQFRQIKCTDLEKTSKVLTLGQKMTHLLHFEHNINCPENSKTVTLTHLPVPVILTEHSSVPVRCN